MNERIKELAMEAGMLNYIDHETPRVYFLNGNADEDCLTEFAKLIIAEHIDILKKEWYILNNTMPVDDESLRDIGFRVGRKTEIISLIEKFNKHWSN